MDNNIFFDRFKTLLEKIKLENELETIHDALILWFTKNYYSLDEEECKDRIIKDSFAEGVDGIFVDDINNNLIFIQAETVTQLAKIKNEFSEVKLKATLAGVRLLIKGDYKTKITPELENYTDEYHELDKSGNYKTKIVFLVLKKKTSDIKFIEEFNKEFSDIEVIFFDFNFVKKFYEEEYLISKSPAPENISFKVITNLLKKDIPYKARVFTAKAEELARLYNDYKERLFQQNVRYSLGLKSKSINQQILQTASCAERSKNFWYYNNGVNIVCKELKPTSNEKIVNLKKAQIINGAQTTYALYEAYKNGNLKDDAEVLIRVIETVDKDFTDLVTLYTNSQNAIQLRDLCSNDDIQTSLQKIYKDVYGFFYERKRGEFESLYPTADAKKSVFGVDYKKKNISNEKNAQSFLALFKNLPASAKSQKSRIFVKDQGGFYKIIFNEKDDLLPEKFLISFKLWSFIEQKKKDYKKEYNKASDLSEKEQDKIYIYDFLLHSEYFILNIFKDFLINKRYDLNKKEDLIKIIKLVDSSDKVIIGIYDSIKEEMSKYMSELEDEPTYYHTKFFKSDKSIALVRNFFKKGYPFVELII